MSPLDPFLGAISIAPGKTLAQKVKAVRSYKDKAGAGEITYPELRDFIKQAKDLFDLTGPQTIRRELEALHGLMQGTRNVGSDEFLASLARAAPPSKPKVRAGSSRGVNARQASEDLMKVISNKHTFGTLVDELTAGRRHTMDQINQVASIFLGYDARFKTKGKAAEALKQRQQDYAVGSSQFDEIENLPV